MDRSPADLAPGSLFQGRWRVVRCIKSGGMGAVYEVAHVETRARSALKVMLPDVVRSAEMKTRFQQEARFVASIASDHITRVFDAGTDPSLGVPFIVMELLEGRDLDAELDARGALPFDEVVELSRQLAFALAKAHGAGIVHRDLKPANLFLARRDDGAPCLKVLDFGIAKLVASSTTDAATTRAIGTPLFMSPEQVRGDGDIGPASDLYAFGHVVYTLLVGSPFWAVERASLGTVYALLMAICAGPSESASARAARQRASAALPPAFDAWFARATALDPRARFPDATSLVEALAALRAPVGGLARPAGSRSAAGETERPFERDVRASPRRRRGAIAAGVGVLALAGAGVTLAVVVRPDDAASQTRQRASASAPRGSGAPEAGAPVASATPSLPVTPSSITAVASATATPVATEAAPATTPPAPIAPRPTPSPIQPMPTPSKKPDPSEKYTANPPRPRSPFP